MSEIKLARDDLSEKLGCNPFPDGGYAVPHPGNLEQGVYPELGMNLRDWFAGQALATSAVHWRGDVTGAANRAYEYAVAMLKARSR